MRILYVFFLLVAYLTLNAQDREVILVYDNSGSMKTEGACEAANYATQVLASLLHPKDELYIIKMDEKRAAPIRLSNAAIRSNMITDINSWECQAQYTPTEVVEIAAKKLSKTNGKKKWLLIFTDGDFAPVDADFDEFILQETHSKLVGKTGANTISLSIGRLSNIEHLLTGETRYTTPDAGADNIIDRMRAISNKVLGITYTGLKVDISEKRATFKTELPLTRLIVVEQRKGSTEKLNSISSALSNDGSHQLYYDPPYQVNKIQKDNTTISAKITHVYFDDSRNQPIPAKSEIELSFVNHPDQTSVYFYPEVAVKLNLEALGLNQVSAGLYEICPDSNEVSLKVELTDINGRALDQNILEKVQVVPTVEDRSSGQQLQLEGDRFVGRVNIGSQDQTIKVSVKYENYLDLTSNAISIVRKDSCPLKPLGIDPTAQPLSAKLTEMDRLPDFTFYPLIDGVRADTFQRKGLQLSRKDNLAIETIETPTATGWILAVKPHWCPCFAAPWEGVVVYELSGKHGQYKPTEIRIPVNIQAVSFMEKCGTLLLIILLSFLGLWYILGIIKKPRFKRGSVIAYYHPSRVGKPRRTTFELTTNFFNRYLVPYSPEKRHVNELVFLATSRSSRIALSKTSQQHNMYKDGMAIENPGERNILLSNNTEIEITKRKGKAKYIFRT